MYANKRKIIIVEEKNYGYQKLKKKNEIINIKLLE